MGEGSRLELPRGLGNSSRWKLIAVTKSMNPEEAGHAGGTGFEKLGCVVHD